MNVFAIRDSKTLPTTSRVETKRITICGALNLFSYKQVYPLVTDTITGS